MSEKEKMAAGRWYDANYDSELISLRHRAQALCGRLNRLTMEDTSEIHSIMSELLGYEPDHLDLVLPFMCDYGENISLGEYVFINTNCYLMDCAKISIGSHTFIGPYCGLYTASHPLPYKYRNQGLEKALPVTIGENCWLGANVSVMPGVTIGNGCVIAAGAVVTKDLPDNCLAAGVPAKIIRFIDQDEPLSD
ncbi:MAG: sugar O-acetyltransferase [Solobacterium sp.]|nr:sugar O-acetyltransferase [Solobacterium sp.]